MKTRAVQIAFLLLCTVSAAALQDMLPAFGGTKPPVLTALVLAWAVLEPRPRDRSGTPFHAANWIPFALLAGAFEDALSGFPVGCATGFLVLAGAVARLVRPFAGMIATPVQGLVATVVAAACHEAWLCMWGVVGDDPSGVVRFFASTLPAAPVGAAAFTLLPRLVKATGFGGAETNGRWA